MATKAALIQYILVISDNVVGWPMGAIVAQGCHAVTACVAKYGSLEIFKDYTAASNIQNMRKAVLSCTLDKWMQIKTMMINGQIEFIEWYEQPENVLTAVAVVPGSKLTLKRYLGDLTLLR
jgi:peptidyl-tRNA hydrolase